MMVLVLLVMVMMVEIAFPFGCGHVTVGIMLWYAQDTVDAVPVVEMTTSSSAYGGLLRGRRVSDHRDGTLLLLLLMVLLAGWTRAAIAVAVLLVVLVLLLVMHVFRFFGRFVPDDPAITD